ncbi:hypothetical protein [Cupriavidus pampae]|uniref:Uncharacterized protein n=1 Tax=Cupriavidus pampae TaxID=659251 RepID=A0ABN7YNF2_9BURK|nr:hypothetical protein [Cupriavidus pampae]CAG9174633.1 hypothetical protein LMG32289_03106 [Cupriavidus pampae]
MPATRASNLVAHLYGVLGLIPGIASLVAAYRPDAPWSELALLGAGWLAAGMFAVMVFRLATGLMRAGEDCGRLEAESKGLKRELDGRTSVLEYVVSVRQGSVRGATDYDGV